MKLKKYILGVFIASTALTSCEIDRFPYSSVANDEVVSSPDYLRNTINGTYGYMKGTLSESWINGAHRLMEYKGDNVSLSGTTSDPMYYMYSYQRIDDGWRSNDFWVRSYRTIAACNNIFENAPEGESASDDHYLGEAYFLRAMMHFYLVNVYGFPYNNGRDNLGVPLKLKSDRNDIPDRSTVGQVYDQVIKDLEKAISLMKEEEETSVKEPFYATVNGARGLLSRVYLYMNENEKALVYADSVINSGDYSLLNAAQFRKMNTLTPETNSEAVFSIRYVTDLDEGDQNEGVGGFYASIDNAGWGEMYASSTYVSMVNYFPNDARQAFIQYVYDNAVTAKEGLWVRHETQKDGFSKPVYKSGVYSDVNGKETLLTQEKIGTNPDGTAIMQNRTIEIHKRIGTGGAEEYYFNEGTGDTIVRLGKTMVKRNGYPKIYVLKCSQQDGKIHSWSPSIVRLAEIYLNKAEALYKLNRGGEALVVLNALRAQRDIPAFDGTAATGRGKTDLLDVILDERRLELAYEGHRSFDVFRNKKSLNRDYPGGHAMNKNSIVTIDWDDNNIIELIPLTQIKAQGAGLVQNPL